MSDVFGLQGKPALVVGAGSGIGRATALLLAQVGANVACADLDPKAAEAVAAEVEALGVKAFAVTGDVLDPAGAEAVVAQAHDALGGLEVVINIVGVAGWVDLLSLDLEAWDLDLRRNLTHHLFVGQAAARRMIADGVAGRMAFVASVSGIYGAPNHAAYGAAKAGVMDLARTMANEWGGYGIRINTVAPDVIATPRVLAGFTERGVKDIDQIVKDDGMPLGRWGKPEEIAGPLVFLVSDLAAFMTGQNLVVDGGTQARFPHGGPKPFTEDEKDAK
jgi:NAD(P)-dependent dehydrogenase (short-subunit alcohol dehydrogenase family)